jgi:hypothetical protein
LFDIGKLFLFVQFFGVFFLSCLLMAPWLFLEAWFLEIWVPDSIDRCRVDVPLIAPWWQVVIILLSIVVLVVLVP